MIATDFTDNVDSTDVSDRRMWTTAGGQSHEKTLNSGGIVEPAVTPTGYRWATCIGVPSGCLRWVVTTILITVREGRLEVIVSFTDLHCIAAVLGARACSTFRDC